jgi:hypothetical protein
MHVGFWWFVLTSNFDWIALAQFTFSAAVVNLLLARILT